MDLEAFLTLRPSNSNASNSRSSTPRLCRAASRSREGSVASSVGTSASTSSSRRSRKRRKISQRSFIAEAEDENDDDEDTDYREPAESAEEVSPSRVRRKSTRAKRVVGKHYESWKRQAARWEEGEDESRQQRRPVFLESAVDTWLDRVTSRTFNARRLYHMARECGQVVCNYVSERLALTFEQRKINLKSDAFVGLRQHLTRFDSRQSDPNRFLTLSANHERLAWSDRWREFFLPYTSMREAHDQRDPPCVAWYCRKFVAGLRQAVLNENWQFVGRQIGSYELTMIRKRAPGADTARTFRSSRNQRYACIPYLPLIWRTGLQRLLQHRLDTDITAKLITEFLVTLIQVDTANKSTQRHRVTIQLSFVDVIVWLIAKEEYELAEHAIVNAQQLSFWQTDRQYDCVLRFYKGLLSYMKWKGSSVVNDTWPSASERDALSALTDLTFAVEMLPDGQGLTALQAAVELLVALERDEDVEEMCINFCSRFPYLAHAVACVLRERDLSLEADKILNNAAQQGSEDVSSSDPMWLDWAEKRVRRPHDFGLPDAVLAETCRVLVNFLDYGENATSMRAWRLLCDCLDGISEEFSSVLRTLWSARSDWWPSFHRSFDCRSVEISHLRESVLSRFMAQTDI